MIESLVLGITQGVVEWLPVSSEGILVLIQNNFFGGSTLTEALHVALFLHLGTFFAALVYFWSDVKGLLADLFSYNKISQEKKNILNFYIIATLISGVLGYVFLQIIERVETSLDITGMVVNIVIGVLLLITGIILLSKKKNLERKESDATWHDGVILGITQGLAAFPGISRSGSTAGVLLLRKFNETDALRMSFIMSLPIVLLGNIILNIGHINLSVESFIGLLSSFVFGLLTIHVLLRIARRVQFGYFVIFFAVILFVAAGLMM